MDLGDLFSAVLGAGSGLLLMYTINKIWPGSIEKIRAKLEKYKAETFSLLVIMVVVAYFVSGGPALALSVGLLLGYIVYLIISAK